MRRAAFSLVEIIVVVALLSVIVLGLLAMFTQTQRAFRVGLAQTDVLEAGRISMELIKREMGQMAPSDQHRLGSAGFTTWEPVNFYSWLPNVSPLYQPLPGGNRHRTNLLEDVFFIYPRNRDWVGVGYFVRTNNPVNSQLGLPLVSRSGSSIAGAGTLYRFESSVGALSARSVADLYREFRAAAYNNINYGTNIARIVEGVVHFKISAFHTDGSRISANLTNNTTDIQFATTVVPDEIGQYYFFSNAVPAAVELEMGILENRTWQHYRALPTPAAQYNYLTGQVGRVHLFRERVPIRNVDFEAYQ